MNRICPNEEVLSEYMAGALDEKARLEVEKHLAACPKCLTLLAETYDVLNKFDIRETWRGLLRWIRENRWLIVTIGAFLASFLFPRHFLQFLAASILMGAKCILDAKNTKMLILIHEAWKKEDKNNKGVTHERQTNRKS